MSLAHIHPMIVHFPIAFALTLAAFDLIAATLGRPLFGRGTTAQVSAGLAVLAGLSAAVAVVFGGMALEIAVAAGRPEATMEVHQQLGTASGALLVVWAMVRAFLWWRDRPGSSGGAWTLAGIEVAAALLIVATAYFGGQLVYEHGVNVTLPAS